MLKPFCTFAVSKQKQVLTKKGGLMIKRVEKDYNVDIVGTFYVGEFPATKNQIIELFGEPTNSSDDEKVKFEWHFAVELYEFDEVFSVTIYDWKEYSGFSNDTPINWHVGAKSYIVGDEFISYVKDKLKTL